MRKIVLLFSIAALIVLAGCAGLPKENTAIAATQTPTAAPTATGTPTAKPTETPSATVEPKNSNIQWNFVHEPQDDQGIFRTKVSLLVSDSSVHEYPLNVYLGSAVEIPATDYESNDIPKEALLATVSWFAGGGDYLYVIKKDDTTLQVFWRTVDEPSGEGDIVEPPAYKAILDIPIADANHMDVLPAKETGE